jgi:hypothetical protein
VQTPGELPHTRQSHSLSRTPQTRGRCSSVLALEELPRRAGSRLEKEGSEEEEEEKEEEGDFRSDNADAALLGTGPRPISKRLRSSRLHHGENVERGSLNLHSVVSVITRSRVESVLVLVNKGGTLYSTVLYTHPL